MIADDKVSNNDHDSTHSKVPTFDEKDPEHWGQVFSIHLMSRGRAHLGLQPEPKLLEGGTAAERLKQQEVIELWKSRRDKAYSLLHEAVQTVPAALEIATIYHRQVEMEMLKVEQRNEFT